MSFSCRTLKVFCWLLLIFLTALVPVSAADKFEPSPETLLPEADIFPKQSSRAQWLWYPGESVVSNSQCLYRSTIFLDAPAAEAWCNFGCDDSGKIWLNGQRLSGRLLSSRFDFRRYDLKNILKPGKNILAIQVNNGPGSGGMILRGEIKLVNGKVIKLFSEPAAWKAVPAAGIEQGWEKVDFDDSQWTQAQSFACADAMPWYGMSNPWEIFASDEEQAARANIVEAAINPPDFTQEKQSTAKVVYAGDMAALEINGKLVPPVLYLVSGDPWVPEVADAVLKSYRAGVRFFEYQTEASRIRTGDGKYDFSFLDRDINRLLTLCPDARIQLRLRVNGMPEEWMRKHPDELIGYCSAPESNRRGDFIDRYRAPSMASELFKEEFCNIFRELVKYASSRPWSKRFVSVRIAHGVYTEWHYYGMPKEMPDCGAAMTKRFRKYLADKYVNDAALAQAWHMPDMTIATAEVPRQKERQGSGLYLRNPNSVEQQVIDYYECHQEVIADLLLAVARAVKEIRPDLLAGAYYGYIFGMTYPSVGQTLLFDKVLSSPAIDFLSAPYCYDAGARYPGGDGLRRTIASIFRQFGKLALTEMDVRTHKQGTYSGMKHEDHSVSVLRRDFAVSMIEGSGLQLLDLDSPWRRPSWWNSPGIQQVFYDSLRIYQEQLNKHQSFNHDIAVIWNPSENIRHDRPIRENIIRTIMSFASLQMHGLYRSGSAFEVLRLEDFLAGNKTYRMLVFLNTFTLNAHQRQQLRKIIDQPGRASVWIYAPGAVSPSGISTETMTELTGMKFKRSDKAASLQIQYPDGRKAGGIFHNYYERPRFSVDDPDAEVMAVYADDKTPAMAVKTLPAGGKVIFSGTPISEPDQWAEFFRMNQMHQYLPSGTVMYCNGNLLLIHTDDQKRSIPVKLPEKVREVRDLYRNMTIGRECSEFTLQSNQSTTWFLELVR